MDKQKQIEELEVTIENSGIYIDSNDLTSDDGEYASQWVEGCIELANYLYNAGYRKIPENAVVLTKEELDKKIEPFRLEIITLSQELVETSQKLMKARKETAEKFAHLRKYMWNRFNHYHDIRNKADADYKKCKDENGKAVLNNDYHRADAIMFILGKVLIEFDEICNEITEGKV